MEEGEGDRKERVKYIPKAANIIELVYKNIYPDFSKESQISPNDQ